MATNAFDDLSIPALDGAADRPADLHLAQAEPPATPPQPAPVKTVVEVAADLTLTLPADATIDQPRVNGTDLEFVQPDGTVIVVPNGAVTGLVIVIGDATIPAETVATIFASNNIETAAGPEGAAAALQSSGGNFATPVPGIGDGLPLIDLLGNTDFGLPSPDLEDIEDGFAFRAASIDDGEPSAEDTSPRAEDGSLFLFDDEGQFDGRPGGVDDADGDAKFFSGNLTFDYGPDGRGATGGIQFDLSTFQVTDSKGDPLTLLQARVIDGGMWKTVDVTVTLSADGQTLTGTWLDATQTPQQAFIVQIVDQDTGEYSISISAALVHPFNTDPAGIIPGSAFEDELNFSVGYVVTDSNGTEATASLQFGVDDDMPEVSITHATETTGGGEGDEGGQTQIPISLDLINLDETTGADVYSSADPLSHDNDGAADDVVGNTMADPTGTKPFGSQVSTTGLGSVASLFNITVEYGADGPLDESKEGPSSVTSTVGFDLIDLGDDDNGVATSLSVTQPALGGNPDSNTGDGAANPFTAYGDARIYLVQVSATEIWGLVGPAVASGNGYANDIAIKLRVVFSDPSDLSTAQIVVEQFMAIDHGNDGNAFDTTVLLKILDGEGSLGLTLTTTAIDGDRDAVTSEPLTVTLIDDQHTFVSIDDDGPTALSPGERQGPLFVVDEDGLTGANKIGEPGIGEVVGTNLATDTVLLDDLKAYFDFGTDGMRSIALAHISEANRVDSGFTSSQQKIYIVSSGDTLRGYTTDGVTQHDVFTLVRNVNGSMTFTLLDQIDHHLVASADNVEALLDTPLDLSAFIIGTDGDGDSVAMKGGAFTVQILDDIPRISAVEADSTSTSTQPITYTIKAGNTETTTALGGQYGLDIKLTGEDLNDNDDTVNTNSTKIGVGDGNTIDGFDSHDKLGETKHPDTGPEILTLDFLKNVNLANNTDGGRYDVSSVSFRLDISPAGSGAASAVLFIGAAHGSTFQPVSVTINGVSVTGTPVFDGANQVGVVFGGVPDVTGGVQVVVTGTLDQLQIGNFNDYAFTSTNGAHAPLTDGNSFKVFDVRSTALVTTTTTTVADLRHDETAGTALSPPNAADDAANPGIPALSGAFGWAMSATSAATFFTIKVGADEPGSVSYAVVDDEGDAFDADPSGLKTTDGRDIVLTTEGGILIGYAVNDGSPDDVAFKVLVTTTGEIWIGQYLPIQHPTGGTTAAAFDEIAELSARLHLSATVTDQDGDAATALSDIGIRVTFQDDGPLAVADSNNIAEGDTSISGNVVTGSDTLGADGAAVGGPVVGVTSVTGNSDTSPVGDFVVAGRYGTLRLFADGSYTYTLDNANAAVAGLRPGQSLNNEIFTYDIADGDGDRASTTLTIRIDGTDDGVSIAGLGATGGDETVYENDLATGTSPSAAALTQTGSFTVTAADGFDDLTVAGQPVVTNGVAVGLNQALPTTYGTITITSVNLTTGVVAYSYTLTDPATHPADGADALFDTIAVLAGDTDGDTAPATLSIKVVDDLPNAYDDQPTQTVENQPVIIDVLANDEPGADGVKSVTLVAPYAGLGTLDQVGGVFTFTPAPGQQGTVTFQYVLTDGDQDSDPATVTITLLADSTPTVSVQSGTVDEKGLPTGSGETADLIPGNDSSETATGTFTIATGGDTLTKLEVQDKNGDWQDVTAGGPVEGTFGTLTVIKTGNDYSWSYTLSGNAAHPDDTKIGAADRLTDAFATRVTDSDGDSTDAVISASETITISINDDGPVAVDDTVATPIAEDGSVLIDVFANDRAGADGVDLVTGVTIVDGPDKGTLLYNDDGTFTYTATAGAEGDDSFTYQLMDGDGDVSTATVTLTIAADSAPQISITKDAALDEDGLVTANADNGLSTEANGGGLYQDTGTIVVDFGNDEPADLFAAFKFQTTGLDDEIDALGYNVTWALSDDDRTLTGSSNGTPVVTIAITDASSNGAGVVTYTYQATLLQPVTHPLNDNEDAVSIDGVPFTVTDKDSDTRSGSFDVAITDDVPELLVSDTPASATEAGDAVNGTWLLAAGADGVSSVTVTFGSASGTLSLSPGSSVVLVQATGTLTVAADHSWSFTAAANQNNGANPQASFTLAATDGDGDKTSDTQVISITDGAGPTTSATPTSLTVDEKAVETAYAVGSAETGAAANASPLETDDAQITFTAGSDNIVSIGFGDPSGITIDSNGDTVADIDWEFSGANLVGKIDGVVAITLSLSGFATIAAGDDGIVTVAATLSDNFPHLFGNNGPNTVVIDGITVVALDTDGTPATANVSVTVVDDVPQIAVESTGPSTVAELGTLEGTWSLNPGADGVPSGVMVSIAGGTYVAIDTGPFVIAGKGELSFGNGTWSFVAASGIDNTLPQSLSFTLKAIDADGDETTDTQSIAITDGAGPTTPVGTTTLSVNEEGLDTVNAHGSVNNASESDSKSVSFTAGTDAITSFAFGSTEGITVFTNGDATPDIAWSIDSGTGNLIGKINDIVAVTLTLTGTGIAAGDTGTVTVAATLSDNFPHISANGENSVTLTGITVIAKDTDNSTATANVSLTVVDDVPGTMTAEPAAIVEDEQFSAATDETNDSTPDYTAVAQGDIRDNGAWGADGFGRVTHFQLGANAVVAVAAGGQSTVYFGKTGTYLGTDSTGAAASLVVNSNGTYTFTLLGNLLIQSGQGELLDTLGTLTLTATDTDGDPATVTVALQVKDDVPLAVAGTAMTVAETAGVTTGDPLLGNDLPGADGASVTHVDLNDGNGFVLLTDGTPSGNGYTFTKAGIGTYTFHADGTWSLDPVVNGASTDQDGSFHYRITDGDGDISEALQTVTVTNANNQPTATAVTAVVDDEGLPHGLVGGGATDASTDKAYAQGSIGSGGDGPLVYSFANGSGAVGQETVNYSWDSIANRLTATILTSPVAGRVGATLFSVDISATGNYTVHLFRPVLHATGNAENNESLALTYTVADSDGLTIGDTASSTLTIDFDDDAPKGFMAQSMTIENGANSIGSGALNFYESIGADGGSVVFTGTNGSNLTSATGNVTSGGKVVHLYGFGTDTLTGKIDLDGNAANGDETTVFTVKLQPSATDENADSYTVQFLRALDDGSGGSITPTTFSDPSSQDYKVANDTTAANKDILISAMDGAAVARVNGSNSGGVTSFGVGGGADISSGELLRFDFATGVTVGSGGNNSVTSPTLPHYDVNGFTATIDTKSGGTTTVRLVAYNANSDTNLTNDAGAKVPITHIYKNGVEVPLASLTANSGGYIITVSDLDQISVVTATGYNRLELSHGGTGQDFSVASIGYLQLNTGSSLALTPFNVTATDADGDTAAGTLAISTTPLQTTINGTSANDSITAGNGNETINGLGGNDTLIGGVGADTLDGGADNDTVSYQNSALGVTVNLTIVGTAQTSLGDASGDNISNVENIIGSAFGDTLTGDGNANVLIGLDGVDTLKGGGGADKLYGGIGDDFLDGEGGIDFLSGGVGHDTLTGGGAADTFAFAEFGAANRDVITDYLATDGDKVDLSAILDSVFAPGSDVSKFVHLATDGVNTTVQVDTTGTGTFSPAGDVAVLNGVHGGDTITFIFDGTDHPIDVI